MASVSAALCCLWLQLQPGYRPLQPAPLVQKPAQQRLSPADAELLQNEDFLRFLELNDNANWLLP